MEFKSISNFRMKWFGVDEIRNLDEVKDKLPFMTKFSFGPFVPYYLYHFFHNIWDMYILQMVASLVMVYLFLIGYYIFYIFALFMSFKNSNTENGSEPFDFMSGFFGSYLSTFFIIVIVFVFLILAVDIGLKIYAGKHCRKLSWNRCEWQSFEVFEQRENNWHIAGIIFFILQMLALIVGICLLIAGILLLKNCLPSLKDILPTGFQSYLIPL